MTTSTTLLVLALLVASLGVAVLAFARSYDWSTRLIVAHATTFAITVATSLAQFFTDRLDGFGLAHAAYLGVTVTVPLVSMAALLLESQEAPSRDRRFVRAVGLLGLVPAVIGYYGTHVEPRWLRVDDHELEVAGLDRPIRVGVLADLQTPQVGPHERRAIDELVASEPDLVLIPGDLYQMDPQDFPGRRVQFEEALSRLTAAVPDVLLVPGDNDDLQILIGLARATGAEVLSDDWVELDVNGAPVWVGGLINASDYSSRPRVGDDAPDTTDEGDDTTTTTSAETTTTDADATTTTTEPPEPPPEPVPTIEALEAAPEGVTTILLAHHPDAVFGMTLEDGVDLVVTGHTHGGQIAVPGFGPVLTFTDVPRSAAAGGLHRVNEQWLYVSTGVGVERGQAPQVRLGVRPSIGVIDLVPAG